jgi:hypothetical protein
MRHAAKVGDASVIATDGGSQQKVLDANAGTEG